VQQDQADALHRLRAKSRRGRRSAEPLCHHEVNPGMRARMQTRRGEHEEWQ
jgi:hypothetical protein